MKVSIITVSYNSKKTIQDTIDSVKSQSYSNIEYIVVDGNSNDGTKKIINSNKEFISKIIIEKDKGIYDAMNKGISLATGDIVGILNSDDVYFNNKVISEVVRKFKSDSSNEIVYGNIQYVSEDLKKVVRTWVSSNYVSDSFKKGWHPPHPGFFVKKELYTLFGNFDLRFNIAADFDLMLRFMEVHKAKSKFLDLILTKMRIGGESNKSISNIIKGNKQVINSFKKYNIKPSKIYTLRRIFPKILELMKISKK